MKTIYKYLIAKPGVSVVLPMPKGAQFCDVQMQGDSFAMWFLVDPDAEKEDRVFELVGTGYNVYPNMEYRGTVQIMDGRVVLHLFERLKQIPV